jgi:hypothetical protein
VAEAVLVVHEHVRVVAQHDVGVHEQVVEVHRVGLEQPALVASENLRDALARDVDVPDRELLGPDQLVLGRRDARGHHPRRESLRVQLQLAHHRGEQALAIVLVVDREVAVEPQSLAVAAQHAHAHGVERHHPHVLGGRADDVQQPVAHLTGGLVGEGDCEDLVGPDAAVLDEMGDAMRQHARLAAARAGKHQQRAGDGRDGVALRRVEVVEERSHGGVHCSWRNGGTIVPQAAPA